MKQRTAALLAACSAATLLAAGAVGAPGLDRGPQARQGQAQSVVPSVAGALPIDLDGLSPLEELGALIFFDETLSIRQNQSCGSCHVPWVGWVGEDPDINLGGSVYEGSRQNKFGNRKPPSSAYATQSPELYLDAVRGFVGGNFWDGRATGWTPLGWPSAEQAQGPFLNPVEQALPDAACVVNRVCEGAYGELFQSVWGPDICNIRWPANTFGQCNSP